MIYQSNVIDITKVKNGEPGATGKILYTWIVYANGSGVDENGALNDIADFSTTNSAGRAYMGIAYNQITSTESEDPADYKWSKIQGAQGEPGKDGQQYFISVNTAEIKRFYEGEDSDGNSIVSFSPDKIVYYAYDLEGNRINFDKDTSFSMKVDVFFDFATSITNIIPDDKIKYEKEFQPGDTDEPSGEKAYSFSIEEIKKIDTFSYLSSKDALFRFSLYKDEKIITSNIIYCTWALSEEYAKFSVTATKIQASVDNAGLAFDTDGLTVSGANGGGIRVINSDTNEKVFEADTLGNAYFAGKISADSGNIGDIQIESGALVGYKTTEDKDGNKVTEQTFLLDSNGLIANSGSLGNLDIKGNLSLISGGFITAPGFSINGTTGEIIAEKITLGSSAKIRDYLQIGDNCWIFNPRAYSPSNDINSKSLWQEDSFIKVNYEDNSILKTAVDITNDGCIRLGRIQNEEYSGITLNGKTGSIYSGDPTSSTYWEVNNGSAIFNNITARGSIKSAVLEYGEVQSIGGIVLVRPSSIIKDYEEEVLSVEYKYIATLENTTGFIVGDFCQIQLSENNKIIIFIDGIEGKKITFTYKSQLIGLIGSVIINFGSKRLNSTLEDKEKETNSYGISLNASDNNSLVPARAISLTDFYYDENNDMIGGTNKIILGYIPSGYGSISGQYGLYADNVLVKGKLVSGTGLNNEITSGIDSLSTVPVSDNFSDSFSNTDGIGNIIFWAGATGNNIDSAPFWVDSKGNMYAGSGYFNGAIITKSTIEAAEIKTATLTGTGTQDYALIIRGNPSEGQTKALKLCNEINGDNYLELTTDLLNISTLNGLQVGNTTIKTEGIVANGIATAKTGSGAVFSSNSIGFSFNVSNISSGLKWNSSNETLYIVNGQNSIELTNSNISMLKDLSIKQGFSLWDKITFKKAYNNENDIIGFDIEFVE